MSFCADETWIPSLKISSMSVPRGIPREQKDVKVPKVPKEEMEREAKEKAQNRTIHKMKSAGATRMMIARVMITSAATESASRRVIAAAHTRSTAVKRMLAILTI